MNETHNASLVSWIDSANAPETDFPIQNLPFGIFRRGGETKGRVGVAIGDQILDVHSCVDEKFITGLNNELANACRSSTLNDLMRLEPVQWSILRKKISALLRNDVNTNTRVVVEKALVPMSDATMEIPASIGDYTDFYASIFHATNVGGMFRPDNPLLPNYKYVPIGYHGRSSSIVVSGNTIQRPRGQTIASESAPPMFGPTKLLDYELEIGFFVGGGNDLGSATPIEKAEENIFGLCLVNDWSARDIQKWEYQPLGPFLAKNFATTVSPWVLSLEAFEPFRVPAFKRDAADPPPLPYLLSEKDQQMGGIEIILEVYLRSEKMREQGIESIRLSRGNFRDMYWTISQMLTHHASNGCNLRAGDLLASGTVSGKEKDSRGCLLELTWRGTEPFQLPSGESRKFLADGDEVIIRGFCERKGFRRIGFGECRGIATASPE